MALKWLLEEELTPEAGSLLERWNQAYAIAGPFLLPTEVTNALHQRVRRGEFDLAKALRLLEEFETVALEHFELDGLHARAMEIASDLGHSAAYDAHYVALAEALGAECWTADGRLYRSAVGAFPFMRLLGHDVAQGA